MPTESEDLQKQYDLLKLFTERQQTEATLHWSRNSYFLVVMSILFLALGQRSVENLHQLASFQVLISILGMALSVIWLLIQDRSSRYINYYKKEARKLAELTNTTDVYPEKLGGFEMRHLAYVLPLVFLAIWLLFLYIILINSFSFPMLAAAIQYLQQILGWSCLV